MGNTQGLQSNNEYDDIWWTNGSSKNEKQQYSSTNESHPTDKCSKSVEHPIDDFSTEFARKRGIRLQILADKRKEIEEMRTELALLKKENKSLKKEKANVEPVSTKVYEEIDVLRSENKALLSQVKTQKDQQILNEDLARKNNEIRMNIVEMQHEIQTLNSQIVEFEREKQDYLLHVSALKNVVKISKELLLIRENELRELKGKFKLVEDSLAEKELSIMSKELKDEYERQLQNIRNLRSLYEERQVAYGREKEELTQLLHAQTNENEVLSNKILELQSAIEELKAENSEKYDKIKNLESSLGLSKAESEQHKAELAVINQLFSRILLGFNTSQELDLDKLIKLLQEHHDLLQDIVVNEVSSEVSSALPKVLLDLVNQITEENKQDHTCVQIESIVTNSDETSSQSKDPDESACSALHNLNSAAEVVENLPKVWRVLIELLSHQSTPENILEDGNCQTDNPCYKTVETPKGPSLVLSVSQTYIRLKNLIVEKKSLEKDMNNLKQLNGHLETRLQDQEKRLEVVTSELSKTWNVVGKLQKEHQLLHTQEKILRYELAQKRKLLKELREELEYSREKWQQAREKNSTTEKQWEQLRDEFAARKVAVNDDANNSVESGFSDEREELSDDEPEYEPYISEENKSAESDISEGIKREKLSPVVILGVIEDELNDVVNVGAHNDNDPQPNLMQHDNCLQVHLLSDETTDIDNDEFAHSSSCLLKTDPVQTCIEKTQLDSKNDDQQQPHNSTSPKKSLEEVFSARDERLKRLEGQCKQLVSQVTNATVRSVAICGKLEDLHEIYGESSRTNRRPAGSTKDHSTLAAEATDNESDEEDSN